MGIGAGAVERIEGPLEHEGQGEGQKEQLGGARADFVASLGRRAAEIGAMLARLEEEPRSPRLIEDVRRRLLALSAGARLLRFTRLAQALGDVESTMDGAVARGIIPAEDAAAVRVTLERLPSLAWSRTTMSATSFPVRPTAPDSVKAPLDVKLEAPPPVPPLDLELDWQVPDPPGAAIEAVNAEDAAPSEPTGRASEPDDSAPGAEVPSLPRIALVAGPPSMAEALRYDAGRGGVTFEVERTDDTTTAIGMTRAIAPDVVVVDLDRSGARELVEALVADPMTEAVPIVVAGRWSKPEDAGAYAALGVARALPKPVSPDALRRACAELAATHERREPRREPLGEVTLAELGDRLADELRRGLCDAATAKARGARVDFGEGSEVLAAVWGAVARIRDITTIKSEGAVRFYASGPEGALPFAPWLGERDGEARQSRVRPAVGQARASAASRLDGMVAVVADDDAAVTWFLADVLAAAGATVHEAKDGAKALEVAYKVGPDLVISDVLMPEVDGFRLCRVLKRDVALRDVPVILLSWKEDLLQRVRELGAEADGYLRKQASAAAIVQRVREVMAPRRRVVERLGASGEVRGRLDGLTTRTLLAMVCENRPSSTLSVWDATHLYEVEIRDGRPIRATRTTVDGSFERGPRVIAALVGVGAARFTVAPVDAPDGRPASVRADLAGTLSEQLLPVIAAARAAQRMLSGEALVHVERVELDREILASVAGATPEPARALLRRVAGGASPRVLLQSGQVAARFFEDVLCDAAARGAVKAVFDARGNDALPDAIAQEADTLRGVRRPELPPAEIPILGLAGDGMTAAPGAAAITAGALEVSIDGSSEGDAREDRAPVHAVAPVAASSTLVTASPDAPTPRGDAGALVTLGSLSPPPVTTNDAETGGLPVGYDESVAAPKATPVSGGKVRAAAPRAKAAPTEARPAPTTDDITPSVARFRGPSRFAPPLDAPTKTEAPRGSRVGMWMLFAAAGVVFAVGARMSREREIRAQALPPPSPPAVQAAAPQEPPAPTVTAAPAPTAAAAAPTAPADRPIGESAANPILPQDLPLRPEDKVPAGQGMLEVVAGVSDSVYVDNRLIGDGPILKLPLAPRPEAYEIRVKLRGEERVRFAVVKEGRLTRVRVAPPWSR